MGQPLKLDTKTAREVSPTVHCVVFDVGQGCCNLVHNGTDVPLLYDCGSIGRRGRTTGEKREWEVRTKANIIKSVSETLALIHSPKLNLIVSSSDSVGDGSVRRRNNQERFERQERKSAFVGKQGKEMEQISGQKYSG